MAGVPLEGVGGWGGGPPHNGHVSGGNSASELVLIVLKLCRERGKFAWVILTVVPVSPSAERVEVGRWSGAGRRGGGWRRGINVPSLFAPYLSLSFFLSLLYS